MLSRTLFNVFLVVSRDYSNLLLKFVVLLGNEPTEDVFCSSLSSLNNGMPSAKVADGSCSSLPSLQSGFNRKLDANVLPVKIGW